MSDHWNSLANLLGTPSIDPPQRKPSTPSAGETHRTESSDAKVVETALNAAEEKREEPKAAPVVAKAEPTSRLRASWDTVARLFGVASPAAESTAPVESPVVAAPVSEAKTKEEVAMELFEGFKGKSARRAVDEPEASKPARDPWSLLEPTEVQATERESRREPASPREGRSERADRSEPQDRRGREEANDELLPERRGRRRNIRRGRDERGNPIADGTSEEISSVERTEGTRKAPVERGDRERSNDRADKGERADRPERGSRGDRGERRERGERGEQSERSERASRGHDREGRREEQGTRDAAKRDGERKPRAQQGTDRLEERGSRESRSGDRPAKGGDRSRGDRPERTRDVWSEAADSGLEERWEELDNEPLVEELGDAESIRGERSDAGEEEAPTKRRRRRRRGGRRGEKVEEGEDYTEDVTGRQAYGRSIDEIDEEEDAEQDGPRIHKVTSWLEAITPMIESNMENHKKNPGGDHRGGRSGGHRGGQRRRGGGSGRHQERP